MKQDETTTKPQGTVSADALPAKLPVLPLRDVVIYPYMIFPVLVGRESSLRAANVAVERDKYIFLSAQKSADIDEPTKNDIYPEGTVAKIIQTLKLPNGLMKILVDGVAHAIITQFLPNQQFLEVEISVMKSEEPVTQEIDALMRHVSGLFSEYIHYNRNVPSEVLVAYENMRDPARKLYYVAANITQTVEIKQKILQLNSLKEQ